MEDPANHPNDRKRGREEGSTQVQLTVNPKRCESVDKRTGRVIELFANYFSMRFRLANNIEQYDVTFSEPAQGYIPAALKRRLLKPLLDPVTKRWIFDGKSIYLFEAKLDDSMLGKIPLLPEAGQPFTATIKKVATKPGRDNNIEFSEALYHIVLRRVVNALKWKRMGRYDFDAEHPIETADLRREQLKVLSGLKVNILKDWTGAGDLLNLDILFKVCQTKSVLAMMHDDWRNDRNLIEENLTSAIVLTVYNNETYRVDGIEWNMDPNSTFTINAKKVKQETGTGDSDVKPRLETFREYYDRKLSDLRQPLLRCTTTRRGGKHRAPSTGVMEERACYLVPELCCMTGIPDKLMGNFSAMQALKRITCPGSQDRFDKIMRVANYFQPKSDKEVEGNKSLMAINDELRTWNIEINPSMLKIQGLVLPKPKLKFGNKESQPNERGEWRDACKTNRPSRSINLERWALIFHRSSGSQAKTLVSTMRIVGGPLGVQIVEPVFVKELQVDSPEEWRKVFINEIKPAMGLQLIVCVLSTKAAARYSAIKYASTVHCPVPVQCVFQNNLNGNRVMSVVTGLMGQIQAKLGGAPWQVTELPKSTVGTMVVGIDFSHFSDRSDKKSVVGFTASLDMFTSYWSEAVVLGQGELRGTNMRGCLVNAIRAFHERNGNRYPKNIVVYRSGVGEGQVNALMIDEVAHMMTAVQDFSGWQPGFCFILALKRTSARFFQERNVSQNPPPGTVIDKCVPSSRHFYLISQSPTQGAVSPTRYMVIHDTTDIPVEDLQVLTYALCHLYYNFPGTISVPAPVHYAGKLAELIGSHVKQDPHRATRKRFFYI